MFSPHRCFHPLCFLNQREGLTPSPPPPPPPCPGFDSCADAAAAGLKARAAIDASNIQIQDANTTRNIPGAPPIVTSVSPSPYASTINTSTIAKNTADVNTLFGDTSSFSSLIDKVNGLDNTRMGHEKIAHINRPDYDLLGCRAVQALLKFEVEIAAEKNQAGGAVPGGDGSGW